MAWGPGRYDRGSATQAANGQPAGSTCDCNKTCCIGDAEVHYQATTNSGTNAVDSPGGTGKTLLNRAAIEFYNAGTNVIEVSNQPFSFGDGNGRPIQPNTSWSIAIGPANSTKGTTHYIDSGSGTFDCRITELGV